jgi:hypothetical protein
MKVRIFNLLVALDIFLFALITLGGSKRNQTMSACAWDMEQAGKWQGKLLRPLIDDLFSHLELNHCRSAYENERHTWS